MFRRCPLFRISVVRANAVAAMGKFIPDDQARFGRSLFTLVGFSPDKITDGSDGRMHFTFKPPQEACSAYGTVHSSVYGGLADMFTTIHLWGLQPHTSHVSIVLDVKFLNPAQPSEDILCCTRVLRFGKKLAFTEFVFCDAKQPSVVFAKGTHTKAIV